MTLVHDYLTQRGGAERVVLAMSDAFPTAPIFTSLFDLGATYPAFGEREVHASPLDRLPVLRRDHRFAYPLLATAFTRMQLPGDVVLCSSSGWAHGVRTDGKKIVYCHSPAKWLYTPDRYFAGAWPLSRYLTAPFDGRLKRWDQAAAASADHYVVNSSMVRRWVQDVYGIDAEVVPPPRGLEPDGPASPVPGVEPGFVLCVSRLIRYKNVEAVVEAVSSMPDQRLVVVGTGPLEPELRRSATANVTFVGRVGDAGLRWLYRNSSAVVAAALEDFGLTPPEAGAFGKPVAALRWGGFLDTVVEGQNGVLFDEAEPGAIRRALSEVAATAWDEQELVRLASAFAPQVFQAELRRVVADQRSGAA